jgi:hypothetical protein
LRQRPELLLGVDDQRVAGNDAVVFAVHHSDEPEETKADLNFTPKRVCARYNIARLLRSMKVKGGIFIFRRNYEILY